MALDCYAKWWWWCSLGPRRGGLRPMSSQPSAPCNRCLMVQSCVCYRLQRYHIDWCRCYSDHIGQSRSNTLVFAYLALRKSSFRSTGPTKITYFSARKRKMVSGEFQIFLLVGHQQKYNESRSHLSVNSCSSPNFATSYLETSFKYNLSWVNFNGSAFANNWINAENISLNYTHHFEVVTAFSKLHN